MFPTVVNNNLQDILHQKGKLLKVRPAKTNAEFYSLLKKKLLSDIELIFSDNNPDNKFNLLSDTLYSIGMLLEEVSKRLGTSNWHKLVDDRNKRLGGFSKRLVAEGVSGINTIPRTKDEKVQYVREYGASNNYPSMVLLRDYNHTPYKLLNSGEESWNNLIETHKLKGIYAEGFEDLYKAVIKDDRHQD